MAALESAPETKLTPPPRYGLREFLDDQACLCSGEDAAPTTASLIQALDGRYCVILSSLSRRIEQSEGELRDSFTRKYGDHGDDYLSAFAAVAAFLDERRGDLTAAGLAQERDRLAVREELVRFLLSRGYAPQANRIPRGALRRFLDEWSERWM